MIKNGYGKIVDINNNMHCTLNVEGKLVTTTMTGNHPLNMSNLGPNLRHYVEKQNYPITKLNGKNIYAEYNEERLLYLELSGKDKNI